jgi:hypothetical protein
MQDASRPPNSAHRPRRSACLDQSRAFELERLRAMTVAERILMALDMKRRFQELKPAPGQD